LLYKFANGSLRRSAKITPAPSSKQKIREEIIRQIDGPASFSIGNIFERGVFLTKAFNSSSEIES
jgi:hypothetical protein